MTRFVALLRGINVGRSTRIAMADLREIFEESGFSKVKTVLQSGNVVFEADAPTVTAAQILALEAAVAARTTVVCRLLVIDAEAFHATVAANPLLAVSTDPSRAGITFLDRPAQDTVPRPTDEELLPERIAFGATAIYQWLPDGILSTKLPTKYPLKHSAVATFRNLGTVAKIEALLDG